jgi:hypothetical protein
MEREPSRSGSGSGLAGLACQPALLRRHLQALLTSRTTEGARAPCAWGVRRLWLSAAARTVSAPPARRTPGRVAAAAAFSATYAAPLSECHREYIAATWRMRRCRRQELVCEGHAAPFSTPRILHPRPPLSCSFSGKDERLCCPICQHCTDVGDGHSLDAIRRSAERLGGGARTVAGERPSAAQCGRDGESIADSRMAMDESGASLASGMDAVGTAAGSGHADPVSDRVADPSGLMDADAAVAGAGCSAGRPSQEKRGPLDVYFALRR